MTSFNMTVAYNEEEPASECCLQVPLLCIFNLYFLSPGRNLMLLYALLSLLLF